MSDPASSRIRRLGELPREIAPPHDGWPALEARLRESATGRLHEGARPGSREEPRQRRRPRLAGIAALAAVLAAVVVGMSIDHWLLSPAHPASRGPSASGVGTAAGQLQVAYVSDPRYLRERAALLRSLDARLAKLPPTTRRKVLQSLAAIHQSMRQIRQALGREPGNALLQELLIDSYQNEMQVLSTVQAATYGSGET
jgi:hypothetical protein